jgi:hypothetical protein
MVSWEKVCKTKSIGGLGLRDLGKLNNIMHAKLWWHWLKYPKELWAKLWKPKYSLNTNEAQLIRFNDKIQGSNIWNEPSVIDLSYKSTDSGKFGMVKMLCFGQILSKNYLLFTPWTTCAPSSIICHR